MAATETPTAPVDTNKTEDKPKATPKAKAPTNDAIKKALATLEAAGIMDGEDQMEAMVAFKIKSYYGKIIDLIAGLNETPQDGEGIAIFGDGEFFFIPQEMPEDEDDEDEDDEAKARKKAEKKAKKKAKKARAKKKDDDETDWREEAKIIQTALIKYCTENEKKAQDIVKTLSKGRNAQPPALTTVYNWLKGQSVPNRKYHRKLRSLLGLNVG